jgi:hypothetical protein
MRETGERCRSYIYARPLPAPSRVSRRTYPPAQLDWDKLTAMGVQRPSLPRRVALVRGLPLDPWTPPDAA